MVQSRLCHLLPALLAVSGVLLDRTESFRIRRQVSMSNNFGNVDGSGHSGYESTSTSSGDGYAAGSIQGKSTSGSGSGSGGSVNMAGSNYGTVTNSGSLNVGGYNYGSGQAATYEGRGTTGTGTNNVPTAASGNGWYSRAKRQVAVSSSNYGSIRKSGHGSTAASGAAAGRTSGDAYGYGSGSGDAGSVSVGQDNYGNVEESAPLTVGGHDCGTGQHAVSAGSSCHSTSGSGAPQPASTGTGHEYPSQTSGSGAPQPAPAGYEYPSQSSGSGSTTAGQTGTTGNGQTSGGVHIPGDNNRAIVGQGNGNYNRGSVHQNENYNLRNGNNGGYNRGNERANYNNRGNTGYAITEDRVFGITW